MKNHHANFGVQMSHSQPQGRSKGQRNEKREFLWEFVFTLQKHKSVESNRPISIFAPPILKIRIHRPNCETYFQDYINEFFCLYT